MTLLSLCTQAQESIVISGIKGSRSDELIDQKILKEAYRRIGYKLVYQQIPAERALRYAASGKVDGVSSRVSSVMQMYPSLIKIPVMFYSVDVSYFSKNSNEVYSYKKLKKLRVGIQRGIKVVENKTRDIETQSLSSISSLFKMLASNRLDVLILAQHEGLSMLNKLKEKNYEAYNKINMTSTPFIKTNLFHYVHYKNKHLVEELTTALQDMKKEGILSNVNSIFFKSLDQE